MEFTEGQKVIVTSKKDGSAFEALFVSAKAGWTVVTVKGESKKVRSNEVTAKITKADLKKEEAAARKAEKARIKAEAGDEVADRLVPADLSKYVLHDEVTASGRKRIDVDDEVAAELRKLDLPATYKYAASVLDESAKALMERYKDLNPGMQRMNLGNRIRKALRIAAVVQAEVKAEKKAPAKRVPKTVKAEEPETVEVEA